MKQSRQRAPLASVQTGHVGLEAIDDGVVRLVGDHYRAVLEVGGVNFALQGAIEQETLLASYAAFLNSLTFPIQILVRVLPIDVEGYLGELERRARETLPEDLAGLARDHVSFLRGLARNRAILERRFYLIVPAPGGTSRFAEARAARWAWPFGRRKTNAASIDGITAGKHLAARCEEIKRQLSRCGLTARRLDSAAMAQLLYACWCPELSRIQRLRRPLAEVAAPVVQALQTAASDDGAERWSGWHS